METAPASRKVDILLVDDQPSRLLTYQAILSELNQHLVCVQSGVEALDQVIRRDFAVILLDVSMPGMDGFETAAMIHAHPRYERTPIIFITGVHDSEFDRLKGYKLGAVDYVSVPIVPEVLRGKVSVLVELHCQRLELQRLNMNLESANAALAKAHEALRAEKNGELAALNADLLRVNAKIADANAELQTEIAERMRAEESLREADRQKNEFIAVLSHELRNPLAPIRNALQIMERSEGNAQRVQWCRELIGRQTTYLSRLVDDLLEISRITRGTINLVKEWIPIDAIIRRAVETIEPLARDRGHSLSVSCGEPGLLIECDPTRLVQILANLLNNSAKYTNPGGRIELAVERRDSMVEFHVRDNGIGIPPGSDDKLFTLFTRLEARGSEAQEGLGIGLALVRRLVDLHGGEIRVESAGVGAGSTFVVRLPAPVRGALTSSESVASGASSDADHVGRRRIVVADDNIDAMDTLAMALELLGHEVWKAANGADAVALAIAQRPDVLVLDIGMPLLNGYEVARRIRQESWGHLTTLIAVTGWGQREDRRRTAEAGFDAHLVKPVDFDALARVLPGRALELAVDGQRR